MTPIPLELVYRDRPERPARGVLLPGEDAGPWLSALAEADVPLGSVEFLPIPHGPTDRRLRGALALLPDSHAARLAHAGPLYGEIAGRIYLPLHGALDPPVAESDWESLLPGDDSRFVWHPAAGLVRIEPEERLRTANLVRIPGRRDADWSRAVPAPHLNTRLFALICDEPPTVEHFFETAGDGIGSSGSSLDQLPRSPGEPGPIDWRKIIGGPLSALAGLLKKMERGLSRRDRPGAKPEAGTAPTRGETGGVSGTGRGVGAGLGSWLAGALAGGGEALGKAMGGLASALSRVTPEIVSARTREIERLLNRFASDPDDALRYALPLTGDAGRGMAPPGWSLLPHSVDFSFGGPSGPVDAWSLPPDLQTSLLAQYREAAQREIRLGRYRRAAYIFSKLLGDDLSAASALEAGQFHREASVLFRDRLRQPLEAARCLARGGLLREAAELYREQRQHVEAGDLFARLDEPEEAMSEYRMAVASRLTALDFIGAAELLSRKLSDEEEAFAVLASGWPRSSQADGCLVKLLDKSAQLGRHELAGDLVRTLRSADLPASAQMIVLERLPQTAIQYPDPSIRAEAAEGVRIVAARFLADGKRPADLPLRALERLVPEDHLLGRDCRRYRPDPPKRSSTDIPRPGLSRDKNPICRLERTISLMRGVRWIEFKGTPSGYFAVGTGAINGEPSLVLQRGSWEHEPREVVSWPLGTLQGSDPFRILLTIEQLAKMRVRLTAALPRRDPLVLSPVHLPEMVIDTPPWLARRGTLAAETFGLTAWTIDDAFDVRTIDTSAAGLPVTTARLPIDEMKDHLDEIQNLRSQENLRAAIHVREQGAWVAIGRMLFVMPSVHRSSFYELAAPVTEIIGSRPHTTARIAILSECGGELFLPTHGLQPLPSGLEKPNGLFLRDGRLVLWTRTPEVAGRFLVLSIGPADWKIEGSCDVRSIRPVGMLPTSRPLEFASLQPYGEIEIWRVAASP